MKPEAPVMMRRGSAIGDSDCTQVGDRRLRSRRSWLAGRPNRRPPRNRSSATPPGHRAVPARVVCRRWVEAKARTRDGYTVPMHEMGIALEIYRVCREAAQAHGGGRIERVRMEIGELAAVEPDLLKFAWEAATTGSPDAGAVLEISWFSAAQHCANCGEEKRHSEGSWLRICPDCGMPLEVTGGDQLDVIDVTLVSDEGQRDDAVAEEAG